MRQIEKDLFWLEPLKMTFTDILNDEDQLVKHLRTQLKKGLEDQKHAASEITKAVYVIRMTGPFIIAYQESNSPVLYVGRGNAGKRLASHLKNWLSDVHNFGHHVGIEIRICLPKRQHSAEFYKNFEADLISQFAKKHGSVPFFNRRKELSFSGRSKYNVTVKRGMASALGIGKGKRPRWAIKPTPANKHLSTYLKGVNPE